MIRTCLIIKRPRYLFSERQRNHFYSWNLLYCHNHIYQNENKLAHDLLLKLPEYSKTTVNDHNLVMESCLIRKFNLWKHDKRHFIENCQNMNLENSNHYLDGTSLNIPKLLETLQQVDELVPPHSLHILKYLSEKGTSLSDEEYVRLILTLIPIVHKDMDAFKKNILLFNILIRQCMKRSRFWTKNQILLVADIWYTLNLPISNKYHYHVLKQIFTKLEKLSNAQFTQCFFYLNLIRTFNFNHQAAIEKKLEEILENLEIQEIGIIALGLFKTNHLLENVIVLQKIVKKLITSKKTVPDITLTSILKLLRLCFNGFSSSHFNLCLGVINNFKSEIHRLSNFSSIQLAALGNHLAIYDEDLLKEIVKKIFDNISKVRLKDIERLCFIIMNSNSNLSSNVIYIKIIEKELTNGERRDEIQHYSSSFLSCVYYLACIGHYNSNLISNALQMNEDDNMQGGRKKIVEQPRPRQLYELDMMLDIEGPVDYDGNRLNKNTLKLLMQKYIPRFPSEDIFQPSYCEKIFLEFNQTVKNMFGKEFVKSTYILPSSQSPSILFCTDRRGNLVHFPSEKFIHSTEAVKVIPNCLKDLSFHAIILLQKTSYIHGSNRLRGMTLLQKRLIEKLGYDVILISGETFKSKIAEEDRLGFLRSSLGKIPNEGRLNTFRAAADRRDCR